MARSGRSGSATPSRPDAAPEPGTVSGAGDAGVGVAPEPGTTPIYTYLHLLRQMVYNGVDGSAAPSGPDTAPEPGNVRA